ncbi:DoxX family protein [Brachybacterium alimentarium]|uniref:DoxX family protein n=1 Tax=Brachybacterium alimentarium TaxID=47845 RepID=UPI003FD036C8
MTGARKTTAFLAVLLGGAGILHLAKPAPFDAMVPHALPGEPRTYTYTYASAVAELGVAGLLAVPCTRRAGGLAATALFVAVYPANLQMAYDWRHAEPRKRAIALARLPLQGVLIAQGLQVARASRSRAENS